MGFRAQTDGFEEGAGVRMSGGTQASGQRVRKSVLESHVPGIHQPHTWSTRTLRLL